MGQITQPKAARTKADAGSSPRLAQVVASWMNCCSITNADPTRWVCDVVFGPSEHRPQLAPSQAVSQAGFAPAGALLGAGARGSSTRSNNSAPLLRTLFTARLTGQSVSTSSAEGRSRAV